MKDSDRLGGQFTPMRASMRARFPIPHEAQHRSREERTDRTAQEPGEGEVILPPELGALGVERCEGQLAAALDESDVGHTRPTLVLPGRDLHHIGQRERADPGVALETSAEPSRPLVRKRIAAVSRIQLTCESMSRTSAHTSASC